VSVEAERVAAHRCRASQRGGRGHGRAGHGGNRRRTWARARALRAASLAPAGCARAFRLPAALRRRDVLRWLRAGSGAPARGAPAGTGGALHARPRPVGAGRGVALSDARGRAQAGAVVEADRPPTADPPRRRSPTVPGGPAGRRTPGPARARAGSSGCVLTAALGGGAHPLVPRRVGPGSVAPDAPISRSGRCGPARRSDS